ncbi:MAG: hypothetical protein QGH33_01560, partial [Pirellulaceae bacterium]|nr:hypothetical protein [Pirellulaceae bacterium]
MHQHHLLLALLLSLLSAFSLPALADEEQLPAETLFEQGMEYFDRGEYEQARDAFVDVDAAYLNKGDRITMWKTLKEIAKRLNPATNPATILENARVALHEKRIAEAEVLFQQVADHDKATGDQKALARTRLSDIRRQPDMTKARKLIDKATADIAAGRIDEAERELKTIQASGLDLGWFDNTQVDRLLSRIAEHRTAMAATSTTVETVKGEVQPVQDHEQKPASVVVEIQTVHDSQYVPNVPEELVKEPLAVEQPAPTNTKEAQDRLLQSFRLRAQLELAHGQDAVDRGELALARHHYEKALKLDPNNEQARQNLDRIPETIKPTLNQSGPLQQQTKTRALRRQEVLAEFRFLINK